MAFSMGFSCGGTVALRRAGLQFASYPLDWIGSPGIVASAKMIAADFVGWFEKATLKLEKPAYVYESRSGRGFGLTDAAEIELKGLDCMLFSVLPYEVKGVAVDAPKSVRKGETLVVKAKVKAKGEGEGEQRMATHDAKSRGEVMGRREIAWREV